MFFSLINGGLGNQVFQYIFTRYLEEKTNTTVLVDDHYFYYQEEDISSDISSFNKQGKHNGYEIDYVFPNAKKLFFLSEYFEPDVWEYLAKFAQQSNGGLAQQLLDNGFNISMVIEGEHPDNVAFSGTKLVTPSNSFNSSIIAVPENTYFYGYWINPGWYNALKGILSKELSFRPIEDSRNKQYESDICGCLSIGVHIRRRDFVTINWALPESYYNDVISKLIEMNPGSVIFVFSDDIDWCKENVKQLGLPKNTVFVEGNFDYKNNYIDVQLMAKCKALVVGNSSFSYLASLLNDNPNFLAIQVRNPPAGDIAMKPVPY